jgi:hypothetical protein
MSTHARFDALYGLPRQQPERLKCTNAEREEKEIERSKREWREKRVIDGERERDREKERDRRVKDGEGREREDKDL